MTEIAETENAVSKTPTAPARSAGNPEPTSYADAINEVEEILASLEGSAIDVDHLAGQVKRASSLLQICRERLAIVQGDVGELVATFGPDSTAGSDSTIGPDSTAGSDADA